MSTTAVPTADELREHLGAKGSAARCPAHPDDHESLSIGQGEGGKVLFKCHAGCNSDSIIEALRARGIWPKPAGLTVTELAAAKNLSEQLLRDSGFADDDFKGRAVVRIQYRDAQRRVICTRYRGAGDDGPRFWFRRGDQQQLFGLWRLRAEPVILVEGETDALALWDAGFNAIGVPGADAWREERFAPALVHCSTLYVHIEPDAGGEKFRAAFERSTLRDRVRFFTVPKPVKDPCELRACAEAGTFTGIIEQLLRAAEPAPKPAGTASKPQANGDAWHLETIALSEIVAKPIVPVLPGVLYTGKVTVIAGLPGDGKSLVSTDIAARISTGGTWPVGPGKFAQARVLMLTAEDDPADTIRPRLDVAGANTALIELIAGVAHQDEKTGKRTLDLVRLIEDLPLIERRIEELAAALFIVDPLTSFAGSDTEKTGDMRTLLDLLSQMAARTGVAILIITHLNKRADARRAMQMIAGSHVITAAVRVVLVTSRDPNNRHRRLILPIKLNIARDEGGFAFTVDGRQHSVAGEAPAVTWEGERVTNLSADDALIDQTPRAQAAVEKSNEVQDWLRDLLHHEPVAAASLWRQAKEKGYGEHRVKRALKAVHAVGEPLGFRGSWHYRLPPQAPHLPE